MARKEMDIQALEDDFYVAVDVETLAKQQGVGPLNFAGVRSLGKFWPEEESIDEFISTVRRWRDEEGSQTELP